MDLFRSRVPTAFSDGTPSIEKTGLMLIVRQAAKRLPARSLHGATMNRQDSSLDGELRRGRPRIFVHKKCGRTVHNLVNEVSERNDSGGAERTA